MNLIKLAVLYVSYCTQNMCDAGSVQCTTDMYLYFKRDKDEVTVVVVYVMIC